MTDRGFQPVSRYNEQPGAQLPKQAHTLSHAAPRVYTNPGMMAAAAPWNSKFSSGAHGQQLPHQPELWGTQILPPASIAPAPSAQERPDKPYEYVRSHAPFVPSEEGHNAAKRRPGPTEREEMQDLQLRNMSLQLQIIYSQLEMQRQEFEDLKAILSQVLRQTKTRDGSQETRERRGPGGGNHASRTDDGPIVTCNDHVRSPIDGRPQATP